MPGAIQIPDQYSYVLAAATSTFFINTFHMVRTSKFRKLSGIKYPASYATTEQAEKDPNAFKLNCAQRAHANFTENLTPFLGALFIAGLSSPVAASALGATWAVSRVVYLLGYTSDSGPKGRTTGSIGAALTDLALKFMAAYTCYTLVSGN
ncbi:hypothetical protein K4F52_009506 [Lecanicillium sp. MT-2017a]|nr:hypothetical protein K4F52_009506 [Lecanicillium sp. MT-2017a]